MEDIRKRLFKIEERISYISQIKDGFDWGNLDGLRCRAEKMRTRFYDLSQEELTTEVRGLEDAILFLEERCEENLSAMDRVRIVRTPLRFSLKDILENVYDEYSELGGEEDANIDPSMVVAKANISRQVKNKTYIQKVMVIGHEKGHGEEYRNGGCSKPWGNEKALRYMLVAQTEGIPIHFYIFTPGSFPIEDYPGAGQQIARNLYVMAKLRVPMVSVISEGGSGGAEAVGMSDLRLMFSHGYYSVISPEGAAAIEGKVREGEKLSKELVENCADRLKITAQDNLRTGTIDRIIDEPLLGARRDDFAFFRKVRFEMIRATDEVVLKTKSLRSFRAYELSMKKAEEGPRDADSHVDVSWELNSDEIKRLLSLRSKKYRNMALQAFVGKPSTSATLLYGPRYRLAKAFYSFKYDILRGQQRFAQKFIKDVSGEGSMFIKRITAPMIAAYDFISRKPDYRVVRPTPERVVGFDGDIDYGFSYTSPLANEDRTVTCPNADKMNCKDLWVPDLYGEFCGVCESCGHHFPLEYEWYLKNLFDRDSIREFNAEISSINPQGYPGLEKRLDASRRKTGRSSSMITFDARVMGVDVVVAMLYSDFRNGTVGAAEGEKFVLASKLAKLRRRPFLSYVHTTGGIRIQEGTLGVIQMPKCTMAVREYIDAGGLYIVVYDNNSYAGPVASFLGCSHYQFAIRSSRIGFAGPRVIKDTTGQEVPPDYHSARNALRRGNIQGIWDRRDFRRNLHKCLMTMGGGKLYYR
ncbi:MAG: acetyl-CoA carboxylase carboxyl transferase subunit alpha/beta [Proteobacteria bacterium]|nr:acetyl-CoA carboxylase carboxyl transferase subunit alpha/beta [Pseudomonadota bacterium]MBU1688399.1 acetyl-CoA carboxylase carboxyl transferase subunit alpha/beta [Pseudomonadota bacterium]